MGNAGPGFKDHFSGHAADYSAHRPTYPPDLMAQLAARAPSTRRALDCGTGSGQAAVLLAAHFDEVVATDASAEQIAHAERHPNITYRVAPAEASGEPDASFDLVTIAQALHWLDHARFFREVQRIVRPGGLFAAISYKLFEVESTVDARVLEFYRALDPYWPPERRHVESGYTEIDIPGEPVMFDAPPMTAQWTAEQALAYLGTWSATRRAREDGVDLLSEIAADVRAAWGDGPRTVVWPLTLVVRRLG